MLSKRLVVGNTSHICAYAAVGIQDAIRSLAALWQPSPQSSSWLHGASGALAKPIPDELPEEKLREEEEEALRIGAMLELEAVAEGNGAVAVAAAADAPSLPGLARVVALDVDDADAGTTRAREVVRHDFTFRDRTWSLETGRLACLADGSAVLQTGGTTVLAVVVCNSSGGGGWGRRRDASTVQLDVDYREKSYAVGRIPGTYNKREGAPREAEVLAGRRVDRALRPLFPRGFAYDTKLWTSVLSADGDQDLDVLAINAASTALMLSDVPWAGPVGAVRITLREDGELAVNASPEGGAAAAGGAAAGAAAAAKGPAVMSLLVAATGEGVVMLEAEVGPGSGPGRGRERCLGKNMLGLLGNASDNGI
jgi:hypothetical protein